MPKLKSVFEPSAARSASPPAQPGVLRGMVQSGRLAVAGELAAGAAHEINNPLFAILTLSGFLLRETPPGTQAHQWLQLIEESATEIQDVVERLHRFVRERPEWDLVALGDVAHDAVELVRHTSAARRKEIVERYGGPPLLVEGCAADLKQAFVNLLANAMQAMPEAGTATVDVVREGRWAVVVVSDEGAGVRQDELPHVFDVFYTTKEGTGTGLGLAVTRAIAELHGGSLEMDSAVERGARFVLRLPLVEPS